MSEKSLHLDPVWLRQKYVDEGRSTYEIAALVGRNPKNIYAKLKDFGIPTRPRGHNLAGADNWHLKVGGPTFAGGHHTEEALDKIRRAARRPRPWLRGKGNGMWERRGPLCPNYKNGGTPERQRLYASGAFKDLLREVFKRDGYHCVRCGAPKRGYRSLQGHHIRSWTGHPDHRFDSGNIVTLCQKCHSWVHSKANLTSEYLWIPLLPQVLGGQIPLPPMSGLSAAS